MPPKKPSKPNTAVAQLADPGCPLDTKIGYLNMLLADSTRPSSREALKAILESIGQSNVEASVKEKQDYLVALINELQAGPLRQGVYIGLLEGAGPVKRGEVILEDGQIAFCTIPSDELAQSLKAGDKVLMDVRGNAILKASVQRLTGEEMELTRTVDSRHVEVQNHQQAKQVMLASEKLLEKIRGGEVVPGATLLINERQKIAFDSLPAQDGHAHYKFLSRESIPDVLVDRDIGNPPACINRITDLIRLEMTKPELRRKYGLRRTSMTLLAGVSGSGKTLAIQAIHRRMYQEMAQNVGVGIDALPHRVFRLKLSTVLSMWLGESDKNLDRFFSEVEQLADEPFICPNGKAHQLPVLAIMEEVDGIARQRGGGDSQHHDRILTTMLQRLDSTRTEMKNKLIVFIGSTNNPHDVDRAFLRRIGGTIEIFGRLDKTSFSAVLMKHLAPKPIASKLTDVVGNLSRQLFDLNGEEQPMLYITYAGKSTPEAFYRRHFLTGAVVDQAVQQAAGWALDAELNGDKEGITTTKLRDAFVIQIASIADQLTEYNAGHYLDLPSGARIENLRRLK